MIYGIFDKSYLLQYTTGNCHLVIPEDISCVNFRRINGYLIRLLQELNDLIVEEYLEKRLSKEHALLEAKKTLEAWADSQTDAAEICNNYRFLLSNLCELLKIPFSNIQPLSLYRFLVYDPEHNRSGMMWLMKPDTEEEDVHSDEDNLGADGKPLTSGDRLLDLDVQVRLGLGEAFDPSVFERYNPIQLEYMGRLVGRINEKTASEAKEDHKEADEVVSEGDFTPTAPLDDEIKAVLAAKNIPLPQD